MFIHGDRNGALVPRRKVRLLVEPRFEREMSLPSNFEVQPGDLYDPESVSKALARIGAVYHLAGAIYPRKIKTLYRVNAEGTCNLVDQCIEKGVRRILYMETDSICGHGTRRQRLFSEGQPPDPYRDHGQSKWRGECYLLEKSRAGLVDGTSLRGFWFFGSFHPPRQQNFLQMIRWKRQIVFGNGRNFRSISRVDNIVAAFVAAEPSPATYGNWYWIGDPKPDHTVDEIYRRLCNAVATEYRPLYIPTSPALPAVRLIG